MEKLQAHELQLKANDIRQDIIEMLTEAKSGHSAGPLGMADVFAALYFNILNIDPQQPYWPGRDRLILSCGHICPVLYASMAEAGFFPKEELKTLRKFNSRLQGHPHNLSLPGIENSSGPLAQGVSQAVGMALAAKLNHEQHHIWCISSDGEHNEGQVWEAILLAAKYKLNNLTIIMDRNKIQIDGSTEEVLPLESVAAKYKAFNWNVIEIDGNNIKQVLDACHEAKTVFEKPTIIIAHTIPGKGVAYMENRYEWHGNPPDIGNVAGAPPKGQQAQEALAELRTVRGELEDK